MALDVLISLLLMLVGVVIGVVCLVVWQASCAADPVLPPPPPVAVVPEPPPPVPIDPWTQVPVEPEPRGGIVRIRLLDARGREVGRRKIAASARKPRIMDGRDVYQASCCVDDVWEYRKVLTERRPV